jgi:hypothetical protein
VDRQVTGVDEATSGAALLSIRQVELVRFFELNLKRTVWINPAMVTAVEGGLHDGETIISIHGTSHGYRVQCSPEDAVHLLIG